MGAMNELDIIRQELEELPAGTKLELAVCDDCRVAIGPVSWLSAQQSFRRELVAHVWHGWSFKLRASDWADELTEPCHVCFLETDTSARFAVRATRQEERNRHAHIG